jgi:hypothetical protein
MIQREFIIERLHEALEPLPYIHAFWLEGADAVDAVDEYSDIDFWVDVEDEYETQAIEAVETALSEIAEIDYKYIAAHDHPQIRQRYYHLVDTSEYLAIDFCWQLHSREPYALYEDCNIESAKVIFDKKNIVRFKPICPADFAESNQVKLAYIKHRRSQYARAMKYVHRGEYLEAWMCYKYYALEPLGDMLRLIYTPAYVDHSFCHISRHIPEAERIKLEYFAQISSLDDIAVKIPQAGNWFDELVVDYGRAAVVQLG